MRSQLKAWGRDANETECSYIRHICSQGKKKTIYTVLLGKHVQFTVTYENLYIVLIVDSSNYS